MGYATGQRADCLHFLGLQHQFFTALHGSNRTGSLQGLAGIGGQYCSDLPVLGHERWVFFAVQRNNGQGLSSPVDKRKDQEGIVAILGPAARGNL